MLVSLKWVFKISLFLLRRTWWQEQIGVMSTKADLVNLFSYCRVQTACRLRKYWLKRALRAGFISRFSLSQLLAAVNSDIWLKVSRATKLVWSYRWSCPAWHIDRCLTTANLSNALKAMIVRSFAAVGFLTSVSQPGARVSTVQRKFCEPFFTKAWRMYLGKSKRSRCLQIKSWAHEDILILGLSLPKTATLSFISFQ